MQGKNSNNLHQVKKHWATFAGAATLLSASLLANGQVKADEQGKSTVVRADSFAVVSRPSSSDANQTVEANQNQQASQTQSPGSQASEQTTPATGGQDQKELTTTSKDSQEGIAQQTTPSSADQTAKWQAVDTPKTSAVTEATQQMQAGTPTEGNQQPSSSENPAKAKAGFSTTGQNDWYYTQEDGSLAKGLQTINGQKLYFDQTTGQQVKGATAKIDKDTYYFDADTGDMWTNRFAADKDGNWFYFGQDGKALKGWQTIDGKRYFFDRLTGIQAKNTALNTDELQTHYFKDNGEISTDLFFQSKAGDWYYNDEKGNTAHGRVTIHGKHYAFTDRSGTQIKGSYYAPPAGPYKYFYDGDSGEILTDSFVADRYGNWYYVDGQGTTVQGTQTINGQTLYFDPYTSVQAKGRLVKTEDNNYHYFDKDSGDLVKNTTITIGNQTYKIDDQGIATKA